MSSNIGMAKVAQLLGPQTVYRYVRAFGYGEKSGIDIPGEIPGSIKPPHQWSKTTITCVPMGTGSRCNGPAACGGYICYCQWRQSYEAIRNQRDTRQNR